MCKRRVSNLTGLLVARALISGRARSQYLEVSSETKSLKRMLLVTSAVAVGLAEAGLGEAGLAEAGLGEA